MVAITFDTHEAIQLLKEKGFSKDQAEALVQFEKSKDTTRLATKNDIEKSISDLKVWVLTLLLGQTVLLLGLMFTMFQFFLK